MGRRAGLSRWKFSVEARVVDPSREVDEGRSHDIVPPAEQLPQKRRARAQRINHIRPAGCSRTSDLLDLEILSNAACASARLLSAAPARMRDSNNLLQLFVLSTLAKHARQGGGRTPAGGGGAEEGASRCEWPAGNLSRTPSPTAIRLLCPAQVSGCSSPSTWHSKKALQQTNTHTHTHAHAHAHAHAHINLHSGPWVSTVDTSH